MNFMCFPPVFKNINYFKFICCKYQREFVKKEHQPRIGIRFKLNFQVENLRYLCTNIIK